MSLRGNIAPDLPPLEELRRIRGSWPGGGWTWDARNSSVASSFNAQTQAEYETIIASVFPSRWDYKSIERAPQALQDIATSTGGIRRGQLIFSVSGSPAVLPYALWWPWGDDATISVRIALSPDSPSRQAALRELFGAE